MSATKVKVFKFFWAYDDAQQETWLRQMANQGLHLKSLNLLCQWTFEQGNPADIAYRVDFPARRDTHFNQLLNDAGWEHAAELVGWQYWRKPVVAGVEPEIFTDEASKAQKFKNVLAIIVVCMLPILLLLASGKLSWMTTVPDPLRWALLGLHLLYFLFMFFTVWRLWKRINGSVAGK